MTPAWAPEAVVTFLFTDIEGSTRRWEADADAMRAALEKHDAVMRQSVTNYGGTVFKHTGDGMCAAFNSPRAAVDAAVAAQHSLELPVRMGIATGDAQHRDGDYFGAVLNRVARLMAAGHGGQILLDGQTAGLLTGVELTSLGERRLRDIAQPVAIHQIRATGLADDFPPLRTVDPSPGNLRPSSTSFVGRDAELVDVSAALSAHRLVTLIGVGGVGKTRLAMETAARMVDEFPDGVWVIELAAVSDPTTVPEAIASTLGITPQPGMTVAESVATALEGRKRLLLFDNCEHLLDATAEVVSAILARSAAPKVLATSREGLRLADERLWPVPSLDVESSAVALFIERALAVAPYLSLDGAREVVAEICLRLDGIPLAIELAASRMQSMSVTEVRDRLHDRFRLLVGSRRGLERHQTLRHAVQWSFDLLGEPEKKLLTTCSVFAGGFGLAAASAIAGFDDEYLALDLLDELVRKSLLGVDRSSARTRFTMLETIRQFAEEQLALTGRADDTRTAHARYFAGREADILRLWDSPQQGEAYRWHAVEVGNLRTAFRWAAEHDDLDSAAAVAFYSAFVGCWAYQHEAVAWAEELIEPAKEHDHRRLAQLYMAGAQCHVTGRVQDAVAYADASRSADASGRYDAAPFGYGVWAGAAFMVAGIPERWIDLCLDLIGRGSGDNTATRTCLAMAQCFGGAASDAITTSEPLLAELQSSENPSTIAWARLAFGLARRDTDPEHS